MIRAVDIQNSLLHLIGWQQSYDTNDIKLADSLTESESGLYFQQVHPLLTLQNLSSIAPDFKNIEFPEYEEKEYRKGNIVSYEGALYRLLQNTNLVDDFYIGPDNADYWLETNLFSEWLENKTKASIQKAITRFCSEKLSENAAKALVENRTLFDGTARLRDTVKNRNNLVGFEIVPIRDKGVTVKINRIGLQTTKAGTYTLYLMHSSVEEPIETITLTKTKDNAPEWFTINNLYLPYHGKGLDPGGSWFLCYKQSELPEGSMAIKKTKDWSKEPCKGCSRREFIAWYAWSRYLEIHPFYINEELVEQGVNNLPYLWDISKNMYTYDNNYGLNLDITVSCDITDFIIEQKSLFQDIIAKQLAVDMLREFAYNANVRTNRHSINASRLDILYELDGDSSSMKQSGLNYQLDQAFKAVKLNTAGIDRVCLPCVNNGIKYRTI